MGWTIGGSGSGTTLLVIQLFEKVITALIKKHKVDLVCLLETKIQEMSSGLVRNLGVGRFLEWGVVNELLEELLCFGITRYCNWLEWKWASSPSFVGLRIARMILVGFLQGIMVLP